MVCVCVLCVGIGIGTMPYGTQLHLSDFKPFSLLCRFRDPTLPQSVCLFLPCVSVVLCNHCLKCIPATSLRTFPSQMMSLMLKTIVALAVFEATVFLSDFAFFDDKLFGGGCSVGRRLFWLT